MFRMGWTSPHEGPGETIRMHNIPWSLGVHRDVDGNAWHIYGVFGGKPMHVWACPRSQTHPYYHDTSGFASSAQHGPVQKWEPYALELVPRPASAPTAVRGRRSI